MVLMNLFVGQENTHTDGENTQWGKERVGQSERAPLTYIHYYV